jgi:flagellar biosynthesis/type III secretory pathway chaperone
MYESLHISDETLKQIVGNYQKIVKLSKSEVAHILDHDIENEDLTETVREKIKSLIAICQLSDRLRRYASYPHVIDPDKNLHDWFSFSIGLTRWHSSTRIHPKCERDEYLPLARYVNRIFSLSELFIQVNLGLLFIKNL